MEPSTPEVRAETSNDNGANRVQQKRFAGFKLIRDVTRAPVEAADFFFHPLMNKLFDSEKKTATAFSKFEWKTRKISKRDF